MIVTTIKIHGLPQKRREILQTVKGLADRVLRDSRCVQADLYQDMTDQDIFYLMEEWQTVDDLEKYLQSKSLAVLLGLENLLVERVEIKHAIRCIRGNHTLQSGECE